MAAPNVSTALVVDDNFYNRDLCTLALSHVGYQVVEACDGMEALHLLASQTFNLLVLDLSMPVLSGIIVLTANPHMITGDVQRRADFIMNKPIDIQLFAQLVERLAQNPTKRTE
jgi:DNA-binding NtrC family response regulator